jgi:hypothetical protein
VPLTQLHLLTKYIPGRKTKMEPYGLVFTREFIIENKAQPALYINSYHGNHWLKDAADKLCDIAEKNDYSKGLIWRFLPFLNAMHERYDFTWEREWRIRGRLSFTPKDVVCIILPLEGEDSWKERFASNGVPVISPGLSYEEIISELSRQQRRTRRIWVEKKKQNRNRKK